MVKFKRKPMVGWYDVQQLASTGIKTLISAVFGSYADKRETLAALNPPIFRDYSDNEELWVDFISDVGDGFNSCFTLSNLLARDVLTLKTAGSEVKLPRGNILVLGGDQVYPVAKREEYQNRFIGPYELAFPKDKNKPSPHLYAVPGNHDWYDGLNNFLKLFCQNRTIGNWQTQQNRSYFAIKLHPDLWLWGIDIQLEADIDKPQLCYFEEITEKQMKKGDKIILCTAEPSWVFMQKRNNRSSLNLTFFEERYIIEKGMQLLVTLSGDLHHYSRYSRDAMENDKTEYHKITSGGGGAFLHPTHNLKEEITGLRQGAFSLRKTFPSKSESRGLVWRNVLFPFYNWGFAIFMGCLYLLFAWLLDIGCRIERPDNRSFIDLVKNIDSTDAFTVFPLLFKSISVSPPGVMMVLLVIGGLYGFCDRKSAKSDWVGLAGIVHGVLHVTLNIFMIWAFAHFNFKYLDITDKAPRTFMLLLEIGVLGGILGSMLMGIYLFLSNLLLRIHDNEAFSSLKWEGYKNFLRLRITKNEIIIYAVGLRKVARWEKAGTGFATEDEIKPELIEEPIRVKLK